MSGTANMVYDSIAHNDIFIVSENPLFESEKPVFIIITSMIINQYKINPVKLDQKILFLLKLSLIIPITKPIGTLTIQRRMNNWKCLYITSCKGNSLVADDSENARIEISKINNPDATRNIAIPFTELAKYSFKRFIYSLLIFCC
jgi:hypothetical protein